MSSPNDSNPVKGTNKPDESPGPRFSHHSKDHINRLSNIIWSSLFRGACYGVMISVPTELIIRWRSPLYRAFGTRIRIFYHTIVIAAAASFHTEREVMRFEDRVRVEEKLKREQLIELSVMQGLYTGEEDGYLPPAAKSKLSGKSTSK